MSFNTWTKVCSADIILKSAKMWHRKVMMFDLDILNEAATNVYIKIFLIHYECWPPH